VARAGTQLLPRDDRDNEGAQTRPRGGGPKFNLLAFHDAILATGGVPLPVLDEYLEAWIKGGGIGPYPEMEK
jgi:hypothetical protein